MIELLEARIAPAIVFTYTDLDGDLVTVTISKGRPGDATFTHPPVPGLFGDQLQTIALNGNQVFNGANITITATPQQVEQGIGGGNPFYRRGRGRGVSRVLAKRGRMM